MRECSGSPSCSTSEAEIVDPALAAHALQVGLPALAVGWIGEHEVELTGGEGVRGEGGAVPDVGRFVALSLEDEIGLADGVGLRVDLLSVEVDRRVLAPFAGELHQGLLGHSKHPAGAAGAVVDEVGPGLDLIGDRHEDEMGHQPHDVARGEVLAGLLVVFLIEAPDELLEDRAHPVVVQTYQTYGAVAVQDGARAEVDRAVQEFLQKGIRVRRLRPEWVSGCET